MGLFKKGSALLGIVAVVGFATSASGQVVWGDDFESYNVGQSIHGEGLWSSWDNDPTWESFVSDAQALSGTNSLDVVMTSDTIVVLESLGMSGSGIWKVTANVWVPSGLVAINDTYFIMQDVYAHGGPYDWRVQLHFDPDTGMILADFGVSELPYVTDEWATIVVDIDLDNDLHSISYNGDYLIEDLPYTGSMNGGGTLNVAAIDLFAYDAESSVYYDDLSIEFMGSGAACLDLTIDNKNAGSPSEFCATGGKPGRQVGIFYSFQANAFDDFVTQWDNCRAQGGKAVECAKFALGNGFDNQVGIGTFDANGDYCRQIPIPCAAGGKTVYFYAVTVGSDGKICDGEVLEVSFAPC